MNNKDIQQNFTEDTKEFIKSKYFLYGFILGITPFLLLIAFMSIYKGGIEYVPILFKRTLILFGIIFSIINAFITRKMISNKINHYLNNR